MARPTTKEKKDAIKAMKAAAKIMKSKTASKSEKAEAKRARDAANKIRKKGGTITELRAKGIGLPAYSGKGSILGTQELYDETVKYRDKVENMSHADAAAIRAAAELARSKAKTPAEKELQSARMRAAGDRMRLLTGRQKGQGTAYTGPGMRVALDAKGNIQRDDQGRVVYDVDPAAYSGRFIPKFTPTAEQKTMWQELFPESDYGITEGLLTPWQQVNMQWMTGSKSDRLGLLDDMGIKATDKNLKLFTDDLKEGRIPASWREAWRTEQWGDVKDPDTGLWKPATGKRRQQAIADQQERYEKGYFNPTTGKGGAARGAPSQWGPGTGLISPQDFVPPGWTGPLPAPGMGITGTPADVGAGIQQGAYQQPAPQDWSSLRYTYAGSPQSELGQVTQTPASRAMFGDKGSAMQPWATGQQVPAGLINYQIPGGTPATVTYSGGNPSLFDFNQQQNNQQQQQQQQQNLQNLTALNQRNLAAHQARYPQHSEQAAALGLTYGTPAYNQWIAANRQGMIDKGLTVGDKYTSQNWIDYQGLLADQAALNGKTE